MQLRPSIMAGFWEMLGINASLEKHWLSSMLLMNMLPVVLPVFALKFDQQSSHPTTLSHLTCHPCSHLHSYTMSFTVFGIVNPNADAVQIVSRSAMVVLVCD